MMTLVSRTGTTVRSALHRFNVWTRTAYNADPMLRH